MRQYFRTRRAKRFRARVEEMLAELDPATRARDPHWLRTQIGRFDELERPIAATMLIERMRPASEEERAQMLAVLREAGAVDSLVRSTGRWMPWRRALAVRTLGWVGAEETVPLLIERLSDRNRYVRESAVRALGRIGDPRALPSLAELFRSPGRVGAGRRLRRAGRLRRGGRAGVRRTRSVRRSSRFASPRASASRRSPSRRRARRLLEPLLADEARRCGAPRREALGQVGGERLPDALARATRDEHATVRGAATGALGSYDDPRGVELAVNALARPRPRHRRSRRRVARPPLARPSAPGRRPRRALWREQRAAWPVERALILASLGAV